MKKIVIRLLLMLAIFVSVILPANFAKAVTFSSNEIEKFDGNDTYFVPYGKEVFIERDDEENEDIESNNTDVAIIDEDVIKVVGTGEFTITANNEEYNFFSWNAALINNSCTVFCDEKFNISDNSLAAKTYLAVLEIEDNQNTFKIEDYSFGPLGYYKGELKGKYIQSYYDKTRNDESKSTSSNFKYSFEEDYLGISLDNYQLTLSKGEKHKLGVTINPAKFNNEKITFTSIDEKVATVNEEGVITAVGEGTTSIVVYLRGKRTECTVTVKANTIQLEPQEEKDDVIAETDKKLEIHFIDVSQKNDAIYIKVGDKSIFVDGGHYKNSNVIIDYLERLGVKKIDYYIGSHSHEEHVGVAGPLINHFGIEKIYVSEAKINKNYCYVKKEYFDNPDNLTSEMKTSATYNMLYRSIDVGGIPGKTEDEVNEIKDAERKAVAKCELKIIKHGDKFNIGDLKIQCLGPINPENQGDIEPNSNKTTLINNNSLILRLDYGEKSFLLTGDANGVALEKSYSKYKDKLAVDLFKNGPHQNSKTEKVIRYISPKYTIIETVDYKLPSQSFVDLLTKVGKEKYKYSKGYKPYYIVSGGQDGNVRVTSNGKKINIKTHFNEKKEPVQTVTLRKINMQVGDKVSLTSYTTIKPAYASNKTLEYSIDNPEVAEIANNGITLKALKEGKATVTVKAEDGKTATAEVNVTKQKMEVHFINTRADGEGSRSDAIFIKVGQMTMLIDGGLYGQADTVTNYIKGLGINKINYYFGSHAHKDHVGAAGQLIKTFKIEKIYVSAAHLDEKDAKSKKVKLFSNNTTINRMIYCIKNNTKGVEAHSQISAIQNCKIVELKAGKELNIHNLKIQCIGPINPVKTKVKEDGGDENVFDTNNYNSLLLRFDFGKNSFLFVGDSGTFSNNKTVKEYQDAINKFGNKILDVDVYKNGHHGNPKSEQVVKWISPKYTVFMTDGFAKNTVVSVEDYFKYLKAVGSKQYIVSSKYNGHVVFETDGENLTVKPEKELEDEHISEFDQRNTAVRAYFRDDNRDIKSIFEKYCTGENGIRGDKSRLYSTEIEGDKVVLSEYNKDMRTKTNKKTVEKDMISYYMVPGKTYCIESEDKTQSEYVKIKGTKRMLNVDGTSNMRDLGGMKADNGTVKYGKIFRSAFPYKMNNEHVLECLDIKLIVNLCSAEKYQESLSHFSFANKVHNPPGTYLRPNKDNTNPRNAVKSIMKGVFNKENVLFHCDGGIDRTGTVAYLVEGILGVTVKERLDDYELSYFCRQRAGKGLLRNSSGIKHLYNKIEKDYWANNKEQEKFINWYLEGFNDKESELELINSFRKAMIDGNPTMYKLSNGKLIEK